MQTQHDRRAWSKSPRGEPFFVCLFVFIQSRLPDSFELYILIDMHLVDFNLSLVKPAHKIFTKCMEGNKEYFVLVLFSD